MVRSLRSSTPRASPPPSRPDLVGGDWIDPDRGRELFDEWADSRRATAANRKTRETYEAIVHKHLRRRFGKAPIAAIDHPTVLAFVAELREAGVAAKIVRNIRDVMRLIFKLPVRSGALKTNPVEDVPVSRQHRAEMVFLDPDQVIDLAREVAEPPPRYRRGDRCGDGYPEYGLFVRFPAFTGLLAGELAGLRVKDMPGCGGYRQGRFLAARAKPDVVRNTVRRRSRST